MTQTMKPCTVAIIKLGALAAPFERSLNTSSPGMVRLNGFLSRHNDTKQHVVHIFTWILAPGLQTPQGTDNQRGTRSTY